MGVRLSIDARNAWRGETAECIALYRQFCDTFKGNFYRINAYYGWKRASMLSALRTGQIASRSVKYRS